MSRAIEELLAAVDSPSLTREEIVTALTFLNMVGQFGYSLQDLLRETPADILLMCQAVKRAADEQNRQVEAEAAKQRAHAAYSR